MAIFQISKIQVRRGKKNTNTGIPQLASGELGWAVDAQELYIGNGSVSEGAPKIGNTRLLTENDNIFSLVGKYTYRNGDIEFPAQTGDSVNNPIQRSLQERLDDIVNVKSFGAFGDGTDQTEQLQRAIDQIYLQTELVGEKRRINLYIPAGVYLTSEPLRIPSYASLVGDGKEKTVIKNNTSDVFKILPRSNGNITTLNEPKYINIENLSVEVGNEGSTGIEITSCQKSTFKNISLKGIWEPGNGIFGSAILFKNDVASDNVVYISENNIFENIDIDHFENGIYSNFTIKNNTFDRFNFTRLNRGIFFDINGDPIFNTFKNCVFDFIDKEGINLVKGNYNTSQNNRFFNVGINVDTEDATESEVPIIRFNQNTNISVNDFFDRSIKNFNPDIPSTSDEYVNEIRARGDFKLSFPNQTNIGFRQNFEDLVRIPTIDFGTVFIDYVYKNTNLELIREGLIEITCNIPKFVLKGTVANKAQLPVNPIVKDAYTVTGLDAIFVWNGSFWEELKISINDEYKFLGNINEAMKLKFRAVFSDNTIRLQARNTSNVISDSFFYTVRVKS